MPYKVHKLPNGKYKAFRQAEGGRPARPLSDHPQSKETADKQIAAIKMNEHGSENHDAGCGASGSVSDNSGSGMPMFSFHKGSSGKYKIKKKNLETMAAPANKAELISKLKLGERQKKKLDMMADVSNEARDPSGKWTSGGPPSGGSQAKASSSSPVTTKSSKDGYDYTHVDNGKMGHSGSAFPSKPQAAAKGSRQSKLGYLTDVANQSHEDAIKATQEANAASSKGLPKTSSGISPEKKAQIAAKIKDSQMRTRTDPRQAVPQAQNTPETPKSGISEQHNSVIKQAASRGLNPQTKEINGKMFASFGGSPFLPIDKAVSQAQSYLSSPANEEEGYEDENEEGLDPREQKMRRFRNRQ